MLIGSFIGSLVGRTVGSFVGAFIGYEVEKRIAGKSARRTPFQSASEGRQELVFLASAAAMLAKMAKADGLVTRVEIRAVEHAFQRLGFSESARNYAVGVFRRAKDDAHSIYEYAAEFATSVHSVEVRELLYELLWDVACADGTITPGEMDILRNIPRSLAIRMAWFDLFARERLRGYGGAGAGPVPPRDELADAYALLGVNSSASDDEVRRAYRDKAKKCHPDVLRAQGLPDEMVSKATEMMAKVNAAWSVIEKARNL